MYITIYTCSNITFVTLFACVRVLMFRNFSYMFVVHAAFFCSGTCNDLQVWSLYAVFTI